MVTIDHVANLAGVSKATVSRVINQRGNVSADTVRMVRDAMTRAQYAAPLPKPTRSQGTDGIRTNGATLSAYALLVPEMSNGLYSSLLRGFEAAAQAQYHQMIVCNTADNVYKQGDDILQLIHKKVSGVAIVPVASATTPLSHIETLENAGIPVVLLHRDVPNATTPLVALPLEGAGYYAGRTLLACGHRRVALFTSADSASANLHRKGFERALAEQDADLPDYRVCLCPFIRPFSVSTLELCVDAALDRLWSMPEHERPTAIYVTADVIAEALFMRLLSRGISIPNDVSVLGFGTAQRDGVITSRLSAVVVDELAIGKTAVEFLEQSRKSRNGDDYDTDRLTRNADLSLAEGETLAHRNM